MIGASNSLAPNFDPPLDDFGSLKAPPTTRGAIGAHLSHWKPL